MVCIFCYIPYYLQRHIQESLYTRPDTRAALLGGKSVRLQQVWGKLHLLSQLGSVVWRLYLRQIPKLQGISYSNDLCTVEIINTIWKQVLWTSYFSGINTSNGTLQQLLMARLFVLESCIYFHCHVTFLLSIHLNVVLYA